MIKYTALLRTVLTAVLLFYLPLSGKKVYGQSGKTGLWVVRFQLKSKINIDEVIEYAAENEITDIFVQVVGRGRAFYKTDLLPVNPDIAVKDFDPLSYLCKKAETKGIHIHAWINVLFIWSKMNLPSEKNHFVNAYRNWFAVDDYNKNILSFKPNELQFRGIEGWFLSPAVQELRDYYRLIASELIKNYGIRGIHLDYIRLPSRKYGYHLNSRMAYKKKYGTDPLLLKFGADNELSQNLHKSWNKFRCNVVDSVVMAFKKVTDSYDNIVLSAAVKPDPEIARENYLQNWESWLEKNIIDFVIVMNYTNKLNKFSKIADKIKERVNFSNVWMGIGTYNQNIDDTDKQVEFTIKNDINNIVFFSYQSILNKGLVIKDFNPGS